MSEAYTLVENRFITRDRLNRLSYEKRPIVSPKNRLISDIRPGKIDANQKVKQTSVVYRSRAGIDIVPFKKNVEIRSQTTKSSVAFEDFAPSVNYSKAKLTHKLRAHKLQITLLSIALLMIGFGSYVTLMGWNEQKVAQIQANKLTAQVNSAVTSSKNSSSSPPSTVKPTPNTIASFIVAPNLPRYLNIPKLGVHARVFSVGLTRSGSLETPHNIYDTDWYDESSLPGQPGAMLIDGHVSSWTAHGVFYGIKTLLPGDLLQIVRGDGQIFNYKVVKTQIYNANNVNMAAALSSIIPGKPGLNLITCTGDVIPGTNDFNERVVVYSIQS